MRRIINSQSDMERAKENPADWVPLEESEQRVPPTTKLGQPEMSQKIDRLFSDNGYTCAEQLKTLTGKLLVLAIEIEGQYDTETQRVIVKVQEDLEVKMFSRWGKK